MTLTFSRLGDEVYFGRLGNQLWQIASTVGIAEKNQLNFVFPPWKYNSAFGNRVPTTEDKLNYPVYKENGFRYQDIKLNHSADLQGYFQSYKYFDHCKNLIKYMFDLRIYSPPVESCSIHVRRGDYLERGNYHTNLKLDYYKKAVDQFSDDTHFFIMSDDLDWCRENFDFLKNKYYSNSWNSEIDDLGVMAGCVHHIIANSSYSWWGAYLSPHKGKVIAPRNWFVSENSEDICPPDWILI